jgi:hypothetical protein
MAKRRAKQLDIETVSDGTEIHLDSPEKPKTPIKFNLEGERFIRIAKFPLASNDHFEAFRAELIYVKDGLVVHREWIGKKDMFGMVSAAAIDLIDPRTKAPESLNETESY